jgi:hypothetical protein
MKTALLACNAGSSRQAARLLVCLLAGAATLAAANARADPPPTLGRLSWLAGGVTLRPPVGSGDAISTGAFGRAEVCIGSTALRLDVGSSLHMDQLDDGQRRLRVDEGTVALRVDNADDARQTVLDTPLGRLLPLQAGEWRIDVHAGAVSASAARGGIRFEGGGAAVTVLGGQRARLVAAADGIDAHFDAPAEDDFEAFVASRDRVYGGLLSSRHGPRPSEPERAGP